MTFDPNNFDLEVFENKTNFFAWIGLAVGVLFLAHFTMSGALAPPVLVLSWIFALVAAAVVSQMPLIRVEVSIFGVSVRERTPFWRREREFAARDVGVSEIEATQNNDGASFYSFLLLLPDGTAVVAGGGNTYEQAEQERLRLLDALTASEQRAR